MNSNRKDFDLNKLKDGSLNISKLDISFQTWRERKSAGVLIRVKGAYGYGSSGESDAKYISWKVEEILDHPDFWFRGMVLDLSQFQYEWGDDIDIEPSKDIPYLVYLAEEKQKEYSFFVEKTKMRFNLRTALAEINEKIKI